MSLVWFPVSNAPCLLTFVVGTSGIAPDDEILGSPGHARKVQAICRWLNIEYGHGRVIAWAKQDPVRIEDPVPKDVRAKFTDYGTVFDRYGNVLYGIVATADSVALRDALAAFLDLNFAERGFPPNAAAQADADRIRASWMAHLLPDTPISDVTKLLTSRRYVILQGPPGTGKTRMAREILRDTYKDNGTSIQFHPNVTYENFVGGLAPATTDAGLQFKPEPGFLMKAAAAATKSKAPYLLHIDEINRADLAKNLGEAVFLLEPDEQERREIDLPYDFGDPFGRKLTLPDNLHILGTMNTADRSLAALDIAIRRRFSFVDLWPQPSVVAEFGSATMRKAFTDLLTIFVDHASGEAFNLVPGHSYFLEAVEERAAERLRVTLAPLLQEYLAQGYVGGFAEPIRAYLQWLESL
jgi:5-methylcytosine-specific restriction protein B